MLDYNRTFPLKFGDQARAEAYRIMTTAGMNENKYDWISHAMRVAAKVSDDDMSTVVAFLHDLFEDTTWDVDEAIDMIERKAGNVPLPPAIHRALSLLTRGDETYAEYIEKIAVSGNVIAIKVKIADLEDHLEQYMSLLPSLKARYLKAYKRLAGEEYRLPLEAMV